MERTNKDFFFEEKGELYINPGGPFEVYKISELLNIDTSDLNTSMAQQAEIYFKVGAFASNLEHIERIVKSDRDLIKAQIDARIRENPEGKLTETKIANMITMDEDYQKAEKKYLTVKKYASLASVLQRAMEHKKDMLVSLSSNMREEMRSEMSNISKKYEEEMRNEKG